MRRDEPDPREIKNERFGGLEKYQDEPPEEAKPEGDYHIYLVWERYDEKNRVLRTYDDLKDAKKFIDRELSDSIDLSPRDIQEEKRGEYSHFGYAPETGISFGYWVKERKLRGYSPNEGDVL
jgi:hypothetical protein